MQMLSKFHPKWHYLKEYIFLKKDHHYLLYKQLKKN
jgi:hypothetical protein